MNVTATTGYKAIDAFTGEEFPAYVLRGVGLIDARTGKRADCPMGVKTIPLTREKFEAMCDALGCN
jgi:hypothetical protein